MFVNIMEFPPIRAGRDEEFRQWFAWSNGVYAQAPGFVSRRLLQDRDGQGGYLGIVEHESEETFLQMHHSPDRDAAWARARPLFDGAPKPRFYDVMEPGS